MNPDWLITASPIFGLAVNVLLQLLVVHSTRRIGLSIVGGALGGLAAALIEANLNLPPGTTLAEAVTINAFVVVATLAFAFNYWVFLNLNITSLRIRTLRDLLAQRQGIPLSKLMAEYSVEEMFRRRLVRLEHGNQIAQIDGKWKLVSRKLLLPHYVLAAMRAVILPASLRKAEPSPREV